MKTKKTASTLHAVPAATQEDERRARSAELVTISLPRGEMCTLLTGNYDDVPPNWFLYNALDAVAAELETLSDAAQAYPGTEPLQNSLHRLYQRVHAMLLLTRQVNK